LRLWIPILREIKLSRAPINIGNNMDLALMFFNRHARRIPAQSHLPSPVCDRKPERVGECGAAAALGLVFVKQLDPVSRQAELGSRQLFHGQGSLSEERQ